MKLSKAIHQLQTIQQVCGGQGERDLDLLDIGRRTERLRTERLRTERPGSRELTHLDVLTQSVERGWTGARTCS